MQFNANDLIHLFNSTFADSENTVLVRGDDEPLYLPADDNQPRHRIIFAHGFFASGLHEIAHWCIAGRERRKLVDYGYWYRPDGRNAEEQAEFEIVEAKPQAIEKAFSDACGKPFEVSIDNLSGVPVDRSRFEQKVEAVLGHYREVGFPPRAQRFIDVLRQYYQRRSEVA
ncbi:MAG: elongation factor P hydroxylase [Gammaproteobacteria bacterium]|nr:elongation factor P hydroxylase [Gammaproteobacteria bacterium]